MAFEEYINVEVIVRLECYVCGAAALHQPEEEGAVVPDTSDGWMILHVQSIEEGGEHGRGAPVCPSCRKSIREAQYEAVTKIRTRGR